MKKYKQSEITPEKIYNKRRKFIRSIGLGFGSISLTNIPFLNNAYSQSKINLTTYQDITSYNNYYNLELERVILPKTQKNLRLNHGM